MNDFNIFLLFSHVPPTTKICPQGFVCIICKLTLVNKFIINYYLRQGLFEKSIKGQMPCVVYKTVIKDLTFFSISFDASLSVLKLKLYHLKGGEMPTKLHVFNNNVLLGLLKLGS